MKTIKIKDVRNKITKPLIVEKGKKIEEVANLFLDNKINRTIYVINSKKEMVGYITLKKAVKRLLIDMIDSDFYLKSGNENFYSLSKFASANIVDDIMETDYIGISDKDSLDTAVKIMYKFDVQELPVMNENREVIGDLNVLEIIIGWKKIKEEEK
ncbi:CBS domain-containing protein [Haliovirga abyssi]|uniref:Histidine kinase n=1 Tax=Haliovirga abyssi TaxID=2996794 RepID=A0AAU9DK11_9FUSO|nr:CBS domain-containing protein [Haliovirga abyssi]BDU51239.1 histidine kinase [Haliovirga abyssi]